MTPGEVYAMENGEYAAFRQHMVDEYRAQKRAARRGR